MEPYPIPSGLNDFLERSNIALAIASAAGDNPLVFVNKGFHSLTGYASEDVVGRNCRMLQGDADNREARTRIHAFLRRDDQTSVRTQLVNFRKDGRAFVNLLYMSKLRASSGEVRFIFASQYDISRSQPDLLADYDSELGQTLSTLSPALADSGIVVEGSLMTIANSVATIAQAKLTLADLDGPGLS